MTKTVMMDRSAMTMPSSSQTGAPTATPSVPSFMMVPRCAIKLEKCTGGMKMTCMCDDAVACSMMQSLCTMLSGGMVSCCCMMNGMMVMNCNLTMGMCKCEMTKDGCMMTCTSGDAKCCEMIQACCDYMSSMMKAGCSCCMMMNNTPVCCCC